MIISRTPFRISFLGGGTDYPKWYFDHGGAVLATSIDKYCYISCRYLPPFFEHKSRIVYSKIECAGSNDAILHPAVRAALRFMKIREGIEIHHDGDLPARAGLGSSSAFTVGLLHALYALKRSMPSKEQLAKEGIVIERDILKENVGSQDQILAAFGGLNHVQFKKDGGFAVCPVIMTPERSKSFESRLMLFFTGFSRFASDIAKEQIRQVSKKQKELRAMQELVQDGISVLSGTEPLKNFGKLLHESWVIKRSLTDKISTPIIDTIYRHARKAGAVGGKLLGAGGGGFILFYVEPEHHNDVKRALKNLLHVPFQFDNTGSQIVFYQPNDQATDSSWFKLQMEKESSLNRRRK